MLATLTATMGDAAFLLLAKEPVTGFFIIVLGFSVGVVTGLFTDWVHGPGFMRPKNNENSAPIEHSLSEPDENSDLSSRFLDRLWMVLILPSIVMGVALAMQYELDELLAFGGMNSPATLWGFAGGMLCLMMWALPRLLPSLPVNNTQSSDIVRRTISDTNFVTSWVVFAFLLFELTVHFLDLELSSLFFICGCSDPAGRCVNRLSTRMWPQILVTTLYLSDFIPLSAQIGNAISNDGDALFPAIALAPKAAIMATLYSAVPALILAYGWFFLVEG